MAPLLRSTRIDDDGAADTLGFHLREIAADRLVGRIHVHGHPLGDRGGICRRACGFEAEFEIVKDRKELLEERGIQVLIFDEISERATSRAAEDALRLARGSRSPLVIALGGLKTLMIGRAAAALAQGELDVDVGIIENWLALA